MHPDMCTCPLGCLYGFNTAVTLMAAHLPPFFLALHVPLTPLLRFVHRGRTRVGVWVSANDVA